MRTFKKGQRVRVLEGARSAMGVSVGLANPPFIVAADGVDGDGDVAFTTGNGWTLYSLPQYLVLDNPGGTIEVYQSVQDDLHYWRLVTRNGKIVADGAEGYASRSNARRAARRAQQLMVEAVVS